MTDELILLFSSFCLFSISLLGGGVLELQLFRKFALRPASSHAARGRTVWWSVMPSEYPSQKYGHSFYLSTSIPMSLSLSSFFSFVLSLFVSALALCHLRANESLHFWIFNCTSDWNRGRSESWNDFKTISVSSLGLEFKASSAQSFVTKEFEFEKSKVFWMGSLTSNFEELRKVLYLELYFKDSKNPSESQHIIQGLSNFENEEEWLTRESFKLNLMDSKNLKGIL